MDARKPPARGQVPGWLRLIHEPAAFWRAAAAGSLRRGFAIGVVRQEFFAAANPAPAEEQQMAAQAADGKIRVTTMVDELRAAFTLATVNDAAAAQAREILIRPQFPPPDISSEALIGLLQIQALAHVFDHFASAGNGLEREHAPAMDFGSFDAKLVFRERRRDRNGEPAGTLHPQAPGKVNG